MITGAQIRMARAALKWSARKLGTKANVAEKTVLRLEATDSVSDSRWSTLVAIRAALESAGIEFIGTPDDGPGIRLRR